LPIEASNIRQIDFDRDKILLVKGPVSLCVLGGEVSCLGAPLEKGNSVTTRSGKVLPFETENFCKLEIRLLPGATVELVGKADYTNNAVGISLWNGKVREIVNGPYRRIMVIGKTDSGKSTFCTFLANSYLRENFDKVVVVDADIGQADLGPPGSISLGMVSKPLFDLRDVQPEILRFIGTISPAKVEPFLEETIKDLISKQPLPPILAQGQNFPPIVMNTDGYLGSLGLRHKLSLVNKTHPDLVVILESDRGSERQEPANPNTFDYFRQVLCRSPVKIIRLEPATSTSKTRSDRTKRRLAQYNTWLSNARVKSVQLDHRSLSIFGRRFEPPSDFPGTFDLLERRNTTERTRLFVVENDNRSMLMLTRPSFTVIINSEAFRGMLVALAQKGEIRGFGLCHEFLNKHLLRIAVTSTGDFFDEVILSAIGLKTDLSEEFPIRLFDS
jgi:polynucleotide 5'-kinase involved in rRNA processing